MNGHAQRAPAAEPREAAALALRAVLQGRSLTQALPRLTTALDERDRALAQQLVYGVLRRYEWLNAVLTQLLERPLRQRDLDIQCLLLVGLYQLTDTRIGPHAAVHATVQAAVRRGKPWARGLINGVLRRFQREAQQLAAAVETDPVARHCLPPWLLERLQQDWPQDWQGIARASNLQAPMTLRVNRRRIERSAYLAWLERAGIEAAPTAVSPDGVALAAPLAVERLPGFADGLVSVQDEAAQLAAGLLDPQPGMRVLDACAAPGGKTAHLLEGQPALAELVAVDIDAGRLASVEDSLVRLGLEARLVTGDAASPHDWWDGRPFDRVLLDAPCSATGVIRRHPDIKRLRRAGDIDGLIARQRQLLAALWPLLRPGGMLLYATCSILRAENDQQVVAFLAGRADAVERPLPEGWGQTVRAGRQILPGESNMDGFYYACLERRHDA